MQPNPKTEPKKQEEVYEQLKMHEQQSQYMTINRPNHVEDNSQLVGQISTKTTRGKFCVIALMVAILLVIALIVSLVAVIIYSPLVSGGDNTTESSASTAGDSSREDTITMMLASHSSQIASMQNLIQNSILIQNNLRQDLDRLRTVNLYEGCINETRTCTVPSTVAVFWIGCHTDYMTISPGVSVFLISHTLHAYAYIELGYQSHIQDTQYFTSSIWCDLSNTDFFVSTSYYKSGNKIRCDCDITVPYTGPGALGSNATCTLTVTKCPYTQNLLN